MSAVYVASLSRLEPSGKVLAVFAKFEEQERRQVMAAVEKEAKTKMIKAPYLWSTGGWFYPDEGQRPRQIMVMLAEGTPVATITIEQFPIGLDTPQKLDT